MIENNILLEKTLYSFDGIVSHNNKVHIIESLEEILKSKTINLKLQKRIIHSCLEILQNMEDYKLIIKPNDEKNEIKFIENDSNYEIIASNSVYLKDFEKLKLNIIKLNSKTIDDLKKISLENLKLKSKKRLNNANNGILRLFILSDKNLSVEIDIISKKIVFFTLKLSFLK